MRIIEQRISVEFAFPVVFTRALFSPDNHTLLDVLDRRREGRKHRTLCYLDRAVAAAHPGLVAQIGAYFEKDPRGLELAAPPELLAAGEAVKNDLGLVETMMATMLDLRLDRHSCVIAIGGGALLDAVGLAAALVHRGLRLIRVPTTALAQNDGAVGVKNAINFRGGKNAIGTFAPPFAVLNDFDFLRTLPDRAWRDGIAEAFKVAIIRDAVFFAWLCENATRLRERDQALMEQLVVRCAELHLEHIRTSGDPFEFGRARPLDFGHWAAHKLELLSKFEISHGEAVAAGVALDSRYAVEKGWLDAAEFHRIFRGLRESGLPLWFPQMENEALFDGLRDFQEHLGGELCITLPRGIGARHEVHEIELPLMRRAISELRNLSRT